MTLLAYVNNLGEQSFKCGKYNELRVFNLLKLTSHINPSYWKGGSLITTRHVLSAAHCILSTLSFVRLGEHDISSTTDGEIQDIKVIMTRKHENYNKRDGTNDIALLYLEHDANLSSENSLSFAIEWTNEF